MKKTSWKTRLILAMIISMFVVSTAWAAPRWSHLTYISGHIEIDDDNDAWVSVVADASPQDADTLTVKCELQQLKNSWKTIKSWTEKSDDTSVLLDGEYAVYKGYSYRIKVTAKAYKGSTLKETVTEYFNYGYYN